MGPESETTVTPANLAMTRTNFENSRDSFARAYAEGQNMLAFVRNAVTGRPDRAAEASIALRANAVRLAEYMGRNSVVSGSVGGFRAELAAGTAQAYSDLQDDVVGAATEAVQTPGAWTGISRFWVSPAGDAVKFVAAAGLAAGHYFGLGYGDMRDIISHAAVAAGAVATLDIGRRLILENSTRTAAGLPDNTAELIRRKTSMDEGIITGDHNPDLVIAPVDRDLISGQLEDRSGDALVEALYANDVQRPPLTRFDRAWTSNLRTVVETTLQPFDQTEELIRSRDIASRSRLARTAAVLAIVGGVTGHYLTRGPVPEVTAESCPIISFPDPNLHAGQSIGIRNAAHLSGMAKEVFFRNAHGRSFDHSDRDKKLLEDLINQDPVGNPRIITSIARTLRNQNPQIHMIDTDTFKTVLPDGTEVRMVGICDPRQLQEVYRQAIETLDKERP